MPEDAAFAAAILCAGRDRAASDARLWTGFLRRDARDVLPAGVMRDFAALLNVRRPQGEYALSSPVPADWDGFAKYITAHNVTRSDVYASPLHVQRRRPLMATESPRFV